MGTDRHTCLQSLALLSGLQTVLKDTFSEGDSDGNYCKKCFPTKGGNSVTCYSPRKNKAWEMLFHNLSPQLRPAEGRELCRAHLTRGLYLNVGVEMGQKSDSQMETKESLGRNSSCSSSERRS